MTPLAIRGFQLQHGRMWFLWGAVFLIHILFYEVTWFSIDQARDLLQAMDIAAGRHFPMNGPLMHWIAHIGPLYYYILAVPFLVYSRPEVIYFFLALVATVTVAGGFWFLSRYFNSRAAWLFVIFYVPSAFVLMDSRALWTPAFLPLMTLLAVSSMAMFFWDKRDIGLVMLALVVGVGSQFHLSFILVIPVFLIAWLLYRRYVQWPTLLMTVLAGILTYAPYLYYQATNNWIDIRAFFHFAGSGAIEAPGHAASYALRLLNYFLIPFYLAEQWLRLSGGWLRLFQSVACAFALLLVCAVIYFAIQAARHWNSGTLRENRQVLLLGFYLGILAVLLGRSADLYYYYFDLLLPVPFFLVALFVDAVWRRCASWSSQFAFKAAACSLIAVYVLLQGGAFYFWVWHCRDEGLMHLSLEAIDLHRIHRAVPNPEEAFMTLQAKREIAGWVTRNWGWNRVDAYHRLLGSRFYDSVEDRGFWLYYQEQLGLGVAKENPAVFWHRSDPLEPWAAKLGLRVKSLGAFRFADLDNSVVPSSWETNEGASITLPVRTVPVLQEYGFVQPHQWPEGPLVLKGNLTLEQKPAQYLLVIVIKGNAQAVSLELNSKPCQPQQSNRTLMTYEHYYQLSDNLIKGDNTIVVKFSGQRNFDLEIFGWTRQ